MTHQLLIAGGGMGGLAAAIAAARAGWQPRLFERASAFGEVGAGIQLGPNSTRLLAGWGLEAELHRVAAFPEALVVRDATSGAQLGHLQLGELFGARYGSPYATVHRADLHALLLARAERAGAVLKLDATISAVLPGSSAVRLRINDACDVEGDALVGADGVWSVVRGQVFGDGAAAATGTVAFRALATQNDLPAALRQQDVQVWLAPRMHLVSYPVRGGEQLNVVGFAEGAAGADAQDWNQLASGPQVEAALGTVCPSLMALIRAMPAWRAWTQHDRPPMTSPDEMVRGRVALLGDAAHPMRPYLAQGCGMALEDAAELGNALAQVKGAGLDVPLALRRYALNRWQRNARVQARALRNGRIFHADGIVRFGRDVSMKLMGERLLDIPWLYRGA